MCVECHKEINLEEKRALIYRKELLGEYWVHTGECLENYKKLLIGPEAIKQGMILGICGICCKPVREKQRYQVGRICPGIDHDSKTENPFYTTFPLSENKHFLVFEHEECQELKD